MDVGLTQVLPQRSKVMQGARISKTLPGTENDRAAWILLPDLCRGTRREGPLPSLLNFRLGVQSKPGVNCLSTERGIEVTARFHNSRKGRPA